MQELEKYEKKTLYELLGVSRNASETAIRDAYREIARVYHPDSGFYRDLIPYELEERDVRIFQLVTNAYNTLVREEQRAAYDRTLPKEEVEAPSVSGFDMQVEEAPPPSVVVSHNNADLLQKMRGMYDEVTDEAQGAPLTASMRTKSSASHNRAVIDSAAFKGSSQSHLQAAPPERPAVHWVTFAATCLIGLSFVAVLISMMH